MHIPDLIGRKFNKLLVLNRADNHPKTNRVRWLCLCDCGNKSVVGTSQLIGLYTKSCGCARADVGKQKILDRVAWNCRCDCGEIVTISQNNLSTGNTTSCGCYAREVISPANGKKNAKLNSGLGTLFSRYKCNAAKRDIPFGLSLEQFGHLTSQNCHYCGIPPVKKITSRDRHGEYSWNGIDRKDNNVGYVQDNCLPCCAVCNRAKLVADYEDFLEWVKRVADNIALKENLEYGKQLQLLPHPDHNGYGIMVLGANPPDAAIRSSRV